MIDDAILRQQLLLLLDGRNAHLNFDDAVANFPEGQINSRPPNVPYTPWHLVEHMRIAQRDILDFIGDPDYVAPKWPDDYWPSQDALADREAWENSLTAFRTDLQALKELVQDPAVALTAELPHATGYTVLREILVVADHNAYHIGEFAIIRQVMGTW